VDVSNDEFAGVADMAPVHVPLVSVNVIGEGDLPAGVLKADAHEADVGKELWFAGVGGSLVQLALS
jgi:hypothetical protein